MDLNRRRGQGLGPFLLSQMNNNRAQGENQKPAGQGLHIQYQKKTDNNPQEAQNSPKHKLRLLDFTFPNSCIIKSIKLQILAVLHNQLDPFIELRAIRVLFLNVPVAFREL